MHGLHIISDEWYRFLKGSRYKECTFFMDKAVLINSLKIAPGENDGLKLVGLLSAVQTLEQIRDLIGTVEGP